MLRGNGNSRQPAHYFTLATRKNARKTRLPQFFNRDLTLSPQSLIRPILLVLLVCVVVRTGVLVTRENAFAADLDAYSAIASTIAQHGVFGLTSAEGVPRAIAFRPPLYPWLLSWTITDGQLSFLGIGSIHVCLALVTVVCVFDLTRRVISRLTGDRSRRCRWIAAFAAGLVTIDPLLLNQSSEVMTETLATAISTVVIYCWYRWYDSVRSVSQSTRIGFGVGLCLAVAYLCRPTFLVWAALLALTTLWLHRSRSPFLISLAIGFPVLVAVVCWTIRNQAVIGHPVWATTHGGYTLLLGNNESFYDYLEQGAIGDAWDASEFFASYAHRFEGDPTNASFWNRDWNDKTAQTASVTEYEDDRLAYRSAVATIKRRPTTFVWSAFVRVGRLWSPMPHQIDDRSAAAVALVMLFYLGIWGAILIAFYRHRRNLFAAPFAAIWLLALTLTAVHAVYWSNMRMRSPIMPAAIMIASLALVPTRKTPITPGD